MTPQTALRILKIVPFALALALVGCGDDGDGTTTIPTDPIPDTVPPGVPTNLSVDMIDGALLVAWDENSEPDLAGYVLQVSLDRGATWQDATVGLITQANFTDDYRSRAEYRVSALDTSENQSAYSGEAVWIVTTGGGGKWNELPAEPAF